MNKKQKREASPLARSTNGGSGIALLYRTSKLAEPHAEYGYTTTANARALTIAEYIHIQEASTVCYILGRVTKFSGFPYVKNERQVNASICLSIHP